MKKKKAFIITAVVIILAVIITAIVIFVKRDKGTSSNEVIYVESVSVITGNGMSNSNRFMGVVETQETKGIDKADDKKVKEVFVKVGDEVKEGDKLFEYDTDEMNLKLKQLELELTSIYNNISTLNSQINTLNEEKKQVDEDHKIEYTSQIQSLQAQINQENYNASTKELEIERQKAAINNSIVYSPMAGVIKSVASLDDNSQEMNDFNYGDNQEQHFITITDMGDYRVKASVSEFNIGSFMIGDRVIIRSRVDETKFWYGNVTSIDTDNPNQNNNDFYYGGGGTSTTKYPVYIALESSEDIMLGQHVYVEFDYGQTVVKDGLWLYEFYLVMDGENTYVWVESNDKIEKRKVELGEYDEELCMYEVVSGLSPDDYIAFPENRIKEGMKTTHNYEDVMDSDISDMDGIDMDGVDMDGINMDDIEMNDSEFEDDSVDEMIVPSEGVN